jgi:hypothetical protein
MDVIMNNYCFGGKVNEFKHSDKGTGVEKLQYSKMPDKALTNRYIKAYRKQKRWWQVWKSSFFFEFFLADCTDFTIFFVAGCNGRTRQRAERLISVRSVIFL